MRTVVISGASSGIGQATARRFARAGDRVVNLDVTAPRDPEPGEPSVAWLKVDTADWAAVRAALRQVHEETGRLDVVVANAGISVRHGVLDIEEADARRITDVNLLGVLGLWQAAARIMTAQGSGVLLATASVNGRRGYPFYADYNATKAGIVALTQTFALELSPAVRVACVSPGAVLTPMQLAEYTQEMLDATNAQIPAGRHAAPDEIAAAFFYLASADARFVTGHELVIDGGETAGATTSAHGTATAVPAVR
ncbi:SDR family NAD(P)-dependent oxidoreductase [Streptomyces sp. 5K101]|uniref:SDR family NAD(P)-dependent oxidoreductase n=1 Tax=Streptomyces sp. 5K101 TaxID=3390037 RepID=UPI0039762A02